jgi:2-polyprenyl-3-methyl-5-hydroxy-6-metoxy-1,4-benzoquinol methylase
MPSKVAEQWEEALASGEAYRHEIRNRFQYLWFRLRPCSRKLKRIIELGGIKPGIKVLDFGAGGGHDSVSLAHLGCEVDALDCSDVVMRNLIAYKESVERYSGRSLNINTIHGDILDADLAPDRYDVIFSCGVMEHFLDERERREVYRILAQALKKGGRVVTFVPNGNHPLRARQRAERLGGYNIEEVDYTVGLFEKDIEGTELVLEKAEGFDLFGYIFILPGISKRRWLRLVIKPVYLSLRLIENWFPFVFMRGNAYWLFFAARKR